MSKASDLRARGLRFGLAMGLAAFVLTGSVQAAVVVNDSWADGGRTNGADPLDTDWWVSTTGTSANSAIEVSTGSLGLVTGGSGRGIHGTFAPQTLNVGDTLKATFTFTTPDFVGTNFTNAFKVGLFNTNGEADLKADLAAVVGLAEYPLQPAARVHAGIRRQHHGGSERGLAGEEPGARNHWAVARDG